MPTNNPRLSVTLSPHRYDLLKRLAALQGTSAAAVVSETMEMVYPVLERVCVVLEAARKAQETRKDGLRDAVSRAEAQLVPLLYEAVSQFDLFMDDAAGAVGAPSGSAALAQVEQIVAREGAGAAGGRRQPNGRRTGANPRTSDTGVRLPKSVDNSKKRGV